MRAEEPQPGQMSTGASARHRTWTATFISDRLKLQGSEMEIWKGQERGEGSWQRKWEH